MNPKSGGKALGLVGPPGVGKTLIAKKLGLYNKTIVLLEKTPWKYGLLIVL
jgi:broad-specificity NMP kinase